MKQQEEHDHDKTVRRLLDKVRHYRKLNKLTQGHLARHLRISQNAYSKLERGISELTIYKLLVIMQILGISIFELLEKH
ncbi:helix-turn-helix transcriptional regulator [Mucilaginibacter mali]|uniref:Helix-turn-helix transcriptional regulator n=1 Tax=Mucilaginibacter mali TaxID=2740462 RepID=A0A7D4Q637_9SPHI|nr:helix-turn-helix transcriptional regulator [Mucilaginibacter mali]QKJ28931.1 helix-turn-helix transcriptional regulator [Mucilaginibacter mali]